MLGFFTCISLLFPNSSVGCSGQLVVMENRAKDMNQEEEMEDIEFLEHQRLVITVSSLVQHRVMAGQPQMRSTLFEAKSNLFSFSEGRGTQPLVWSMEVRPN
jgi:nanoRNase/pAp phosphatase (c-di-AMP/oligoRNAs hydrolase)